MGDIYATPSKPNPSSTAPSPSTATMDSSNSLHSTQFQSEPINDPNGPESKAANPLMDAKIQESQENQAEESNRVGDGDEGGEGEEVEEEEEEGECGFCLFMKGGGCKDAFVEWEKCVEEGEKRNEDIVEKCFQATSALKKCMEAHSDYYAPLLEAEKAAEEEAAKQLWEEKERLNNQEKGGEELGYTEKEETLDGSEKKGSS